MTDDAAVRRFLAGVAYPADGAVPYPRADRADADRLPRDTWGAAQAPVGVRLEFAGDAQAVEIDYTCATDRLPYAGAGSTFAVWAGETAVDEQPAVVGEGTVRLRLDALGPREPGDDRHVVHLPEGMRPTVLAVRGVDGDLAPAPARPRWLAYGDSITAGWCASAPALNWTSVAARRHRLDVINLGYAGSARAEIVSAEGLAKLPADVISIAVGTNCWNRIPHSAGMLAELFRAFLDIVRQGHPSTPVVVLSPLLRPEAETSPNRLGATLRDLRAAMEDVTTDQIADGDSALTLVAGAGLIGPAQLHDVVHPNDEGHRVLAGVLGDALAGALGG